MRGYTPEARLAELDRNGLHRAVVSLPPTMEATAELVEAWHEDALDLERSSGGRLIPLSCGKALPGFVGAVVPAPALEDLDAVAELLDRLAEHDQFAFVHPSAAPPADPAWRTSGVAYTHQMLQSYASWLAGGARRWPQLRIVFALLGGGAAFQIERFVRRGLDPGTPFAANIWFETSSYGERALELSLQTFGARRLVFGSDAPVDRVSDARAAVGRFGAALELELLVSNPLVLLSAAEERWAA